MDRFLLPFVEGDGRTQQERGGGEELRAVRSFMVPFPYLPTGFRSAIHGQMRVPFCFRVCLSALLRLARLGMRLDRLSEGGCCRRHF